MIYILLNIGPITAATLASLVLGAATIRLLRMNRPSALQLAIAVLAHFWLAAILAGALILAPVTAGVWIVTFGTAIIIWCGFVLPVCLATLPLFDLGWKNTALAAGYWLIAMVVQAAILRIIGLTAPNL